MQSVEAGSAASVPLLLPIVQGAQVDPVGAAHRDSQTLGLSPAGD